MRQELLVIDRKDTQLEISSGRLTVRIAEQKPISIALAPLERIIIATPVQFSSQLLNRLASYNLSIVFLPNHQTHTACWIMPSSHGDHQRRLQQYALCSDSQQQNALAYLIVRQKLLGQKRNLLRWQKQFVASKSQLQQAVNTLNTSLEQLSPTAAKNTLMGLEGAAASAYFQGIAAMLGESYGFKGRNRRPPKDPINSVLSLSYTLAQQEAETALTAYGLDTGLGVLHSPSYGRASLGCDLVELLRPLLDNWVLQLFVEKQLLVDHFYYQDEACLLGKAGREHYFKAWAAIRQQIKRRCHKIVRASLKLRYLQ